MTDRPRLIEVAFPLKQASLDSVHEKNVRHGHISTLHIWPARRPLAACRAALIATLLPDPGDPEARKELLERIGGRVVKKVERKKVKGRVVETVKEVTQGGILHWGREQSPDLDWFWQKIREAYNGRAPRVLDPFAGGGAIPLEAMRLGCEATAIDINPVAWFILKCTLEYPQKLAGQTLPLPKFALQSQEFMESFRKGTAKGLKRTGAAGKKADRPRAQKEMFTTEAPAVADLAWHVRAWGHSVLERVRDELAAYYPVVDGKPTVAYLWARTVRCKNCRATVPLLKTRWLCRKEGKRVLLTMKVKADATGVDFGIEYPTAAQAKDKKLGAGTMSQTGAKCPCCPAMMTREDIRVESQAQPTRLGTVMTAVVVDGMRGKEYRLPGEMDFASGSNELPLPGGPISELINTGSISKGGVSITRWGIRSWSELFTARQLSSLSAVLRAIGSAASSAKDDYPPAWAEAISAYLALMLDRLANQSSMVSRWNSKGEKIEGTFARFALPLVWDFAELNPLGETTGGFLSALGWVALVAEHLSHAGQRAPEAHIDCASVLSASPVEVDVIITDPPYYDAIPYSDLMDFFYVWLKRVTPFFLQERDRAQFLAPGAPKWTVESRDGELIEDESRFGGDQTAAKNAYEEGMARAFGACFRSLSDSGRFVVVFANKQADAWETLVAAIIRAGFVVDGSWPIQTERTARARSLTSAALSSSVWLVCKKRLEAARPGWDNRVLGEMREKIHVRLREFWDAGIRGPDFVWAATGPALEAYSKHPVVKKANEPGLVMSVGEFLRHVRRMVADFVVGRVLTGGDAPTASSLDDLTTYYLLHRHDFGLEDAPASACILYALSCGLSDDDLTGERDLLVRTGKRAGSDENDPDEDIDESDVEEIGVDDQAVHAGSGSKMRLRAWTDRKRKSLGMDAEASPAPLIDQVHRLMHLWRDKNVTKVDDYLDQRILRKSPLFHQLLQALIELAPERSDERSLLESLSNHIAPGSHALRQEQTAWRFAAEPSSDT